MATHYLLDPGTQIQLYLLDSREGESKKDARVVRKVSDSPERGEAIIGLGLEFI